MSARDSNENWIGAPIRLISNSIEITPLLAPGLYGHWIEFASGWLALATRERSFPALSCP